MTESEFSPEMRDRFARAYRNLLAVICVCSTLVWVARPSLRTAIAEENGFLEMLTAMIFLFAALLGTVALIRSPGRKDRLLYGVIPFGCSILFLDEISYGQVFYHYEPITIGERAYPIDGFHDLGTIVFKLWRDECGQTGYTIGALLLGALISLAFLTRRRYMPWVMQHVRTSPVIAYFRLAVILILIAQVLDLGIIKHDASTLLEELLEMAGGLALLFAAVLIRYPNAQAEEPV